MNKADVKADRVRRAITDSARTVESLSGSADAIAAICAAIIAALKSGHKILTAGNGGSAAEAMHMAEEFIGRFRTNRPSLPAVSLAADCTALTCIANDFGYDTIFSRQVEGLGKPGDVLVVFSTSGKSPNIKLALDAARSRGMKIVCFLGKGGGPLAGQGDHEIVVESSVTERIQEVHLVLIHIILDAVEAAYVQA